MPDIINQPNANYVNPAEQVGVWQYPSGVFDNPAASAREEYQQRQYVDFLAGSGTESRTAETAQPPISEANETHTVNSYETVPPQGEIAVYATNTDRAIDPHHSEVALHAVREVFGAEHQAAALKRATAFGPSIEAVRDRALIDWGREN